ncbi:MAG: FtsQ-type POTRA domain-containing protein [Actinobacteria bacterium]|nr:FtsQ-type POTRA domain-containing protein [Actinomycetota bacterium]
MTRARGASRPRFRLLPTILLTLAILLLPTAVYAWGRSSSSFDVATITVSGTRLVPEKQVLKLLRRDYEGRNLFTVTGEDVRETLAPLCLVSGASIDRDFPDTLRVSLTEYQPAAYALARGRWYVLDPEGRVVCRAREAADQLAGKAAGKGGDGQASSAAASAETSSAEATSAEAASEDADAGSDEGSLRARLVAGPGRTVLPLPRIAVAGKLRAGTKVTDPAAVDMIQVIVALPRSLQRRLAVVESDDGQLTLRFDGGPVVVWGDAGRALAKTVAMRTVLREYESAGKTCTQMDVSIPDRTLARPVLR